MGIIGEDPRLWGEFDLTLQDVAPILEEWQALRSPAPGSPEWRFAGERSVLSTGGRRGSREIHSLRRVWAWSSL